MESEFAWRYFSKRHLCDHQICVLVWEIICAEVHNDLEEGLQEHTPIIRDCEEIGWDDEVELPQIMILSLEDRHQQLLTMWRRVAQLLDQRVTCEEVANSLNTSSHTTHPIQSIRRTRSELTDEKIVSSWRQSRPTLEDGSPYSNEVMRSGSAGSSSILTGSFIVRLLISSYNVRAVLS